jgi:hypothetical protein
LSKQIERLPLDRELREDIRLGVEHLSDLDAAEQARRPTRSGVGTLLPTNPH